MDPSTALFGFLKDSGWAGAQATPITPDWSPRHFWRVAKDGRGAVLIHAPVAIPGHGLEDFAKFAGVLNAAGLSAPAILASSPACLLVEDFGTTPIDTPAIEREAYTAAVDALTVMRGIPAESLTRYHDGYIYKKLALFSDDPAWMAAWEKAEAALPPCPYVFSHMDYKAGNLHWLPERAGIRRVGILDFQAAQCAPFVYDIVNLLEDARRDMEPDLKAMLKTRFFTNLPTEWQDGFEARYVFTAAQFHARVLGQIRNNPRVSADVAPRLLAYLSTARDNPVLSPLREFLK